MMKRFGLVKSLLIGCLLLSSTAIAETFPSSYPAERYRMTPDRSAVLDVEFGRVLRHLNFDAGLYLGGANDPLVLYKASTGERVGSVVTDRAGGSLVGTIGLFDWVQLGVEIPFVLYQAGQQNIAGVTATELPKLQSLGFGDIRFVPKIRLLKSEDHFIDAAVLVNVFVPTGGGSNFMGDEGVIVSPELALSRAFGQFRLALNGSATLLRDQKNVINLDIGNELTLRLGAGYRFFDQEKGEKSGWELDASAISSTSLEKLYAAANQQSVEAKAQIAYHFENGMLVFLGGGTGLQPGWGTPDWRVNAGVRFGSFGAPASPIDTDGDGIFDDTDLCINDKETVNGTDDTDGCPEVAVVDPDTDKDGILNVNDKCPTEPEDIDTFEDTDGCIDPDNDKDGILDVNDKCPLEPEDKDDFEDADGCIDPDDDKDGILDVNDACRLEPEDKDGFEDENGCPDPDNDKDGILDVDDACPIVAGIVENKGCPDVDTDGDTVVDRLDNCPQEPGTVPNKGCKAKQLVVLLGDKLEILDSVYFKLNKAIIETRSYPLLDNVAQILVGHPEIKLVRVEGHTDSQGDDASNMTLSDNRAKAVVAYLVKKGIAVDRLRGVGFGETKPIADNANKPGRAKNRRVEFNIGEGTGVQKSDNGPSKETFEK